MNLVIEHDADKQQFFYLEAGLRSIIDYELQGNIMTITHTLVPPALAGRGIAAALTRKALETAQSQHWQVVPRCSYAAAYIQRHPEFAALLP